MTAPTIAEMRAVATRIADLHSDMVNVHTTPAMREHHEWVVDALRAAAEILAIVEWAQRQWPEDWARNVMWFKQEAERKEKERADG